MSTKLYKLDSKGKTRVIEYLTEDDQLIQRSGILDGKFTETIKVCKGKNIGRSNETTPEEQAVSEMESKISKKLDQGYVLNSEDAVRPVLPMLAKEYKVEKKKLVGKQVAIQPKLDGQRAMFFTSTNTFMSRKGVSIDTCDYIVVGLKALNLPDGIILDGELYKHGLDFQETMKHLKKKRTDSDIKFNVYDLVEETMSYEARRAVLESFKLTSCENVELVEEIRGLFTDDFVAKEYAKRMGEGYEGVMVRVLDSKYEISKRSSSLIKYKEFQDMQLKVVDVIPGDSYTDQGILVCEIKDTTVKASYKGNWDARRELLTNKKDYIGLIAEIRFFELSHDGIPRFPICCGFREDTH